MYFYCIVPTELIYVLLGEGRLLKRSKSPAHLHQVTFLLLSCVFSFSISILIIKHIIYIVFYSHFTIQFCTMFVDDVFSLFSIVDICWYIFSWWLKVGWKMQHKRSVLSVFEDLHINRITGLQMKAWVLQVQRKWKCNTCSYLCTRKKCMISQSRLFVKIEIKRTGLCF